MVMVLVNDNIITLTVAHINQVTSNPDIIINNYIKTGMLNYICCK